MDINSLFDSIDSLLKTKGQKLELDISSFGGAAGRFFSAPTFAFENQGEVEKLSGAVALNGVIRDLNGSGVSLREGRGKLTGNDAVSASLIYFIVRGATQHCLILRLPDEWRFEDAFPKWQTFGSIPISDSEIVLASASGDAGHRRVTRGMSFSTNLVVPPVPQGGGKVSVASPEGRLFQQIRGFSNADRISLEGEITLAKDRFAASFSGVLGEVELGPGKRQEIVLALVAMPSEETDDELVFFRLTTDLEVPLGSSEIRVPLISEFKFYTPVLFFVPDFSSIDGGDWGISDLSVFNPLLSAVDIGSLVPSLIFDALGRIPLFLSDVVLGLRPEAGQLHSLSFVIGSKEPLRLLDPVSIENLQVGVMTVRGDEAVDDEFSMTINGSFFLGDTKEVELQVGTSFPEFGLHIELAEGNSIEPDKLFSHFVPGGVGLPTWYPADVFPTITRLWMTIDPSEEIPNNSFNFAAEKAWEITTDFHLTGVECYINVENPPDDEIAVTGFIAGSLSVAGSPLRLSASLAEQICFRGELPPYETIQLGAIIDRFAGGAKVDLPLDVEVTEFFLEAAFNTEPIEFSEFSASLAISSNWDVGGSGIVLESVSLGFRHTLEETNFESSGLLRLGESLLSLSASFESDEGWRFSGESRGEPVGLKDLLEAVIPGEEDVLPDDLPDIVFHDLKAEFTTASDDFHNSFSFTGIASVELNDFLKNPAVKIALPESARFRFGVGRQATPRKDHNGSPLPPGKVSTSIIATIDEGDGLTFSTDFAWAREIGGKVLREVQNDDGKDDNQDPIQFSITAKRPIDITLIEMSPENGGSTKFLSGMNLTDWQAELILMGRKIELDRLADSAKRVRDQRRLPSGAESATKAGSEDAAVGSDVGSEVAENELAGEPNRNAEKTVRKSKEASTNEPMVMPFLSSKSKTPPKDQPSKTKSGKNKSLKPKTADGKAKQRMEGLGQCLLIKPPSADDFKFEDGKLTAVVPAIIKISTLELDTELPLSFDLQTMSFKIDHFDGVKVMSAKRSLFEKAEDSTAAGTSNEESKSKKTLFGLEWDFLGAPVDPNDKVLPAYEEAIKRKNNETQIEQICKAHEAEGGRFHHLTLVTKDMDYQIQQAPGAQIEIAYTKASKEPIMFGVSHFALSSKGLSVTAEVLDRPATLNGVNTKFRFSGSKLVIVDNDVKDLTLSGSGPLPPKLVGDAVADISLQFRTINGDFTLVEGNAEIKGDKLLSCEATRFQFQLDAIGLKFVNDGGFHLYFTLTGKAKFVLGKADSKSGALSWLPSIQLDLHECPLTDDVSVLAKHISFLVELPRPVSFPFLGAYEYELRAIGFIPQFEKFDDDASMLLSGQIKFAKGKGDATDQKPDLHKLYVGLPEKGKLFPRLYMDTLPLAINMGDAFKLNGTVEFIEEKGKEGFQGEGVLEIKGLPPVAASFGFFRIQRSDGAWVRAWFIYLEARHLSLRVPYLEFHLREIGLGFGYRYTLTGIKAADRSGDLKQMIKELNELSKTQGDLAEIKQWAPDIEEPGENPRWTIVLRAMFSQSTAAISPISWNERKEKALACAYLFDVVASFRSDLTFFMTARGWINTNYGTYDADRTLPPFVTGFILLSVRQKRLLAHVAKNPAGKIGSTPALPEFVKTALESSDFSATLLLEPGLMHMELGWPNMLRWSGEIGPLKLERRGGFIFRITDDYLLIGISCMQRGTLRISAEVDLGFVGASLSATADIAMGARLMALVDFKDDEISVYGAMGLDLQIKVRIELWIDLLLTTLRFKFSFELSFTAGLEFGIYNDIGIHGKGRLSVKLMGHRLSFSAQFSHNAGVIEQARANTQQYMSLGLTATDVDTSLPGIDERVALKSSGAAALSPHLIRDAELYPISAPGDHRIIDAAKVTKKRPVKQEKKSTTKKSTAKKSRGSGTSKSASGGASNDKPSSGIRAEFTTAHYAALAAQGKWDGNSVWYFALVPAADDEGYCRGFLPMPPSPADKTNLVDYSLTFPDHSDIERVEFKDAASWKKLEVVDGVLQDSWTANWNAVLFSNSSQDAAVQSDSTKKDRQITLASYLENAFFDPDKDKPKIAADSPKVISDERVQNSSDDAYEAAVRGAVEQFRGSPFFKHDPDRQYDQLLAKSFQSIAADNNGSENGLDRQIEKAKPLTARETAMQVRGIIVQSIVDDLLRFADSQTPEQWIADNAQDSVAFQMGLIFRVNGKPPSWMRDGDEQAVPRLRQRNGATAKTPVQQSTDVKTYNPEDTGFGKHPPRFEQVQQFTDAGTVAIAWQLVWDHFSSGSSLTDAQKDPEHHLQYYRVIRREMDGNEAEHEFRVKSADVVHEDENRSPLAFLRPRFQIVDQFHETAQELASLPSTGRSYLYSITPVDLSGTHGRPLTLVATRYPNEPPLVPVEAKLNVHYELKRADLVVQQHSRAQAPQPELLKPRHVELTWTEPALDPTRPQVAIESRRLVFRKFNTMPIGSYGLDSETQRNPTDLLPTSNAIPLPTDVKVPIKRQRRGGQWYAVVSVEQLQSLGVFPTDNSAGVAMWRPESWQIFVQTISTNDVPSALAPVQINLQFSSPTTVTLDGAANYPRATKERGPAIEERSPAELEWLPRPVALAMLPPEDEMASVGLAHVPMPNLTSEEGTSNDTDENSSSDAAIVYREHPDSIRCIEILWNQGPSCHPDYPIDLSASYDLFELDADSHTEETFQSSERLRNATRHIQEVQMVSADQLRMVPSDTLTHNQWQAWYPSHVHRIEQLDRLKNPSRAPVMRWPMESDEIYSPWYSWRDSILVWPKWSTDENAASAIASLHPFLQRFVEELKYDPTDGVNNTSGTRQIKYIVDVQPMPAFKPEDVPGFFSLTAAAADPFGWMALQILGLSVTVTIRELKTGTVVSQETLTEHVSMAARTLIANEPELQPHAVVEWLFQPSRSVQITGGSGGPSDMLAMVQLSLRPYPKQIKDYFVVKIEGEPLATVELSFDLNGTSCVIFNPLDPGGGLTRLGPSSASQGSSANRDPVKFAVTLPDRGAAVLFLQSLQKPTITFAQNSNNSIDLRVESVGADDVASPNFPFEKTELANSFTSAATEAGKQWENFAKYVDNLSTRGTDNQTAKTPFKFDDPDEVAESILPDFIPWSMRFFDSCAIPSNSSISKTVSPEMMPALATAYPRVESPAHVAPDQRGRLVYQHLIRDGWAHNYRFYIQPTDRYGLLWQGLLESKQIFRDGHDLAGPARVSAVQLKQTMFDPEACGLDVVLDRTAPIDMPLVLSSKRLDPEARPGQPTPPGATWEVIVAQHREQILMERNQTVARRLSYRQIAFTLLRRFVFDDWVGQLSEIVPSDNEDRGAIELLYPANVFPSIPESVPTELDHLPFLADGSASRALTSTEALSVDLPDRLGSFQQAALVLQWQGLPFFYEHQLLLVAQSATTVSPVNRITQRDFEYRSPLPSAQMTSDINSSWQLRLPLCTLWDSMTDVAQEQNPEEKARLADGAKRRPGSLPDKEVAYQIFAIFGGNIELQAEVMFDTNESGKFQLVKRQLAKRFLLDDLRLQPPQTAQGEYVVSCTVKQQTPLTIPYTKAINERIPFEFGTSSISPFPTGGETAETDLPLIINGVMTREMRNWLLINRTELLRDSLANDSVTEDSELIDRFYGLRESNLLDLPSQLAGRVEVLTEQDLPKQLRSTFSNPSYIRLTQPLSDADAMELAGLLSDDETGESDARLLVTKLRNDLRFKNAVERAFASWQHVQPVFELDSLPLDASRAWLDTSDKRMLCWDSTLVSADMGLPSAFPGNQEYKNAIKRLAQRMATDEQAIRDGFAWTTVTGAVPASLPKGLRVTERLLKFQGLMGQLEARQLLDACTDDADRRAIKRLYEQSNTRRTDTDLYIVSRRGSASPSKMVAPTAIELTDPGNQE